MGLLSEPRPTQADAIAFGKRGLLVFEGKFTEVAGHCSQPNAIGAGPHKGLHQCNGNYEMQKNPVSGTHARCALTGIEVVHVNSAYVRGPGGVSWPEFFARVDVTDAVAARLAELPPRLTEMSKCLKMGALPDAEPGKQCNTPYDCEFWHRCTADKPADRIAHLTRLSAARASHLEALGIDAICSIAADFSLTAKPVIIRDALVTGRPYVATDIQQRLQHFGPAACYLDFEAMMPPIPSY